jgi:trk system potassium uptake protein TrkH
MTNDHTARKTITIPSITSANIQILIQSHNLSHSLLSDKAFREALLVIVLFVALSFVSSISIKYLTNTSFIDAFFESVSASTNTGLSTGITNVD